MPLIAIVTLVLAVLLMPDVFSELKQGAIEHPVFGGGFLAVLALVVAWIDRS